MGITESQEACIDDFINQQKSANTNKNLKATDMNTLLRYIDANGMKNEKIESLIPASELDHFLSRFVRTHGGKRRTIRASDSFQFSA